MKNTGRCLTLTSHLLGVSINSLISTIRWNDAYLSWHDDRESKTLERDI